MTFKATIIEESLEDKAILKTGKIISTKVYPAEPNTNWIKNWTIHQMEIPENQAKAFAQQLSESIDNKHASAWYADFGNEKEHYVIFRGKIFHYPRGQKEGREQAIQYGILVGIPVQQLDWKE